MNKLIIPTGYKSVLSVYETQTAIGDIKRMFEDNLSRALNLKRISAPLFVESCTGLNDDLSGVERPVEFDIPAANTGVQIVQSLAKWKRMALYRYRFPVGEGIYTDMNAIRRDESLDNLHSVYVDQWDWEKIIDSSSRNRDFLEKTVIAIVHAICDTADQIKLLFPALKTNFERNVTFITTQQLEDTYPELTPRERENTIVKKHKTVFITGIGDSLRSGNKHDARAPDYDDWTLNGDIFFWDDVLECAIELSSMAIRVDSASLDSQLSKADCDYRRKFQYHTMLLAGELPLTIGGGIGQSRLCMLLLQKAHIGEVQVSVWDTETVNGCKAAGIALL